MKEKLAVQSDPMAAVMAGIRLTRDRHNAQAEVERLRAELSAASERAEEYSDEAKRTLIRQQDRRALLAGRVFLTLVADDPDVWTNFWPHLSSSLERASDSDRGLFDLPPRSKPGAKKEDGNQVRPPAPADEKPPTPTDEKLPVPPIKTEEKQENSMVEGANVG